MHISARQPESAIFCTDDPVREAVSPLQYDRPTRREEALPGLAADSPLCPMKPHQVDPPESPEKTAALRNIRRLMAFWQIEPHELHGVPAPRPKPAPTGPRYRHPVTHEAWDGEGPQPDWLRQALLREGYTVEELRRCAAEVSTA